MLAASFDLVHEGQPYGALQAGLRVLGHPPQGQPPPLPTAACAAAGYE